jgi:NADP-reducing hydrogenase subunit HndA
MSYKITQGKFVETAEQKQAMDEVLAQYKGHEDAAVTVLEKVQVIYGYLPEQVLARVADALNKSMEDLYSIGTFYSQFSLYPKGKYNFSMCLGTACYVNGAKEVNDKIKELLGIEEGQCTDDGMFSVNPMRCVGCCGLAPVLTVNEEVYGKLTPNDVEGIITKYRNK